MTKRLPSRRSILALATALEILGASAMAQLRGGRETFSSPNNADSWSVFDGSDNQLKFPAYNLFPEENDPDIFFAFGGDAPLWFFADAASSAGSFVGDFSAARVTGMGCNIFLQDFNNFDSASLYLASGTDGRFYFSFPFTTGNYFLGAGWDFIEVGFFSESWFYFEGNELLEATLTEEILANVVEVGMRCFPKDANAAGDIVAIDNFFLLPEVIPAELTIAASGANVTCSFPRLAGQSYSAWSSPDLANWLGIPGHQGVTGTTPYVFQSAMNGVDTFFQVSSAVALTEIPDIGPP